MVVTLTYDLGREANPDTQQDVDDALKASSMRYAAYEFDQKLRSFIKHNVAATESEIVIYEKLRDLHRECWETAHVSFQDY